MIKKITLNEDLLKLIKNIKFEAFNFGLKSENARFGWGIDQYSLFGGTYYLEDASIILGLYDKHIPGTEEDPLGVDFPDDVKEKLWGYYDYIVNNMEFLISLILYFSDKGGLTPGTYRCVAEEKEWSKVAE